METVEISVIRSFCNNMIFDTVPSYQVTEYGKYKDILSTIEFCSAVRENLDRIRLQNVGSKPITFIRTADDARV